MSARSELNQANNRNGDLLTVVSGLQKENAALWQRIEELAQKLADEEFHAEQSLLPRIWEAEQALTAERQRRESAEAALCIFVGSNFDEATGNNATAHFSRYLDVGKS